MVFYPKSISLDDKGTFVGVGSNTPYRLGHNARITEIEVRDSETQSAALIKITFDNGEVLKIRTNFYMASCREEAD